MAVGATTLSQFAVGCGRSLLDLFWPPVCPGCGGDRESSRALCFSCETSWPVISGLRCEVCSQPFAASDAVLICQNCRERNFHFVASLSPLRAHGAVREMVHRLKYNRERWLAGPLAGWMAQVAGDERLPLARIDALVPVPLHPLREREREFNQAELLARELAKAWHIPMRRLLRRQRPTETQTHFDRRERMRNLRQAFVLAHNAKCNSMNIVLVDDVFTTGSTLDECARTLLDGGAAAVWAVTAARA
jgi:ComF family protein